jgi:acyl-CoA synthetase (NDP forming)
VAFSSFAGGDLDQEVVGPLSEAGVAFLDGTETALLALRHFLEHRGALARNDGRDGHGTAARHAGPSASAPAPPATDGAPPRPGISALSTAEGLALLREAGIPAVETLLARDADAAVRAAYRVGYPVALKIDSPDIAHKSDVGGVRLGLADARAVRRAFDEMLAEVRARAPGARLDGSVVQPMAAGGVEMILGVKRDPVYGPAVVCGFGGVLVEIFRDVAVRVPPFDLAEARAMLGELRGGALLRGARGSAPPADTDALADAVVRLGALAAAGRVRALDLNPLLVLPAGRGVVAVDWLIEPA